MLETSIRSISGRIEALRALLNLIDYRDGELANADSCLSNYDELTAMLRGDRVADSTMRHSAVIISLYALYEHFIDSVATELLAILPNHFQYDELSEKLRKRHRVGFGEVLSKKGHRQFSNLDEQDMLDSYRKCLNSESGYTIVSAAYLYRTTNLRGEALREIFAPLPFEAPWDFLKHHKGLNRFFEDESVAGSLDEMLSDFVDLRNEVAHGVPDQLLGPAQLRFWCDFVEAFCKALSDFAIRAATLQEIESGYAFLGNVIETFPKSGNVAVIKLQNRAISEGDTIYAVKNRDVRVASIVSLQIDDAQVQGVSPVEPGVEVGVETDVRLLKKSRLAIR